MAPIRVPVRNQNPFVRGADLSRAFYERAVAPLLNGVPHAAGRLGHGSDVLGLDDERSRDHDWGCRLTVVVDDGVDELQARLEREPVGIGSVEQWCDNVDVLASPARRMQLRTTYDAWWKPPAEGPRRRARP